VNQFYAAVNGYVDSEMKDKYGQTGRVEGVANWVYNHVDLEGARQPAQDPLRVIAEPEAIAEVVTPEGESLLRSLHNFIFGK